MVDHMVSLPTYAAYWVSADGARTDVSHWILLVKGHSLLAQGPSLLWGRLLRPVPDRRNPRENVQHKSPRRSKLGLSCGGNLGILTVSRGEAPSLPSLNLLP